MYCAVCKELMVGQKMLKDLEGYDYPYDKQICEDCRLWSQVSEEELNRFLKYVEDNSIKL